MKKSGLIFGIILLFGASLFAQERTWKPYTPATGEWTVLAPGQLTPDSEATKPNSKRGSFSYNDSNGFFAVIFTKYSNLNIFPWKKEHFSKQRDLVMKANKATLIKDEEITVGNLKGREVRLRMPDNRTFARETSLKPQHRVQRFRMFFQGNKFYMILAVLPEDQVSSPEIDKYFDSFTFK